MWTIAFNPIKPGSSVGVATAEFIGMSGETVVVCQFQLDTNDAVSIKDFVSDCNKAKDNAVSRISEQSEIIAKIETILNG